MMFSDISQRELEGRGQGRSLFVRVLLVASCAVACQSTPLRTETHGAPAAESTAWASFESAQVNGTTLQYARGGSGPALVLLHGFPQDSSVYQRILPPLSERFSVVAPDLRGIGGSAPAADGFDAANLAVDIHQLMLEQALEPAFVVGHDIGAMVAYALGRAHPEAVRGVMLVETVIPGLDPWDALKSDPTLWHFGFFQSERFPELLLTDREVMFFR